MDEYMWRCRHCKKKHSIREDSFFSRSHQPLTTLVMLVYFWIYDVPLKTINIFLKGVSGATTNGDWMNFCRDICSDDLIRNPVQLGGVGDILEVD